MSSKLYPERQRCAQCRKKLEDVVCDGMYCSYACAGVAVPVRRVDDAPRECKRQIDEKWDFKRRYKSEEEIPIKLRQDPGTNIYRCNHCRHLHVGHSRPAAFTREKLNRVVGDLETMGTVLTRARENKGWTIKRLAAHLKVPMIRIKEIEAGDKNARIDIAIAAYYAVGIRMVLQER